MLRRAARRLHGVDAQLLRMDLRDLALPKPVQTLTCTFDTLNYLLDPRDVARAFGKFALALHPGGTLMFDFIPRGASSATASGRQRVLTRGILSEWRVRIDPEGRGSSVAILMRDTARPEARPRVEIHRQRWHAPAEIRALLAESGFEILDWRPTEPGGGDGWLHVVARRTAAPAEARTP